MNEHSYHPPAPQRSWWAGLGIVFAILFAAGFVLTNGGPSINASPTKVMDYYNSHKGSGTAGLFFLLLSTVALAFFSAVLRARVFPAGTRDRALNSVSTLATAVWISGLLLMAFLLTALQDASHYGHADAIQSINILSADDFFPVVFGLCAFALATGLGMLRSRSVPRWLGWFTLLIGVLAGAGPIGGIAFLLAPIWAIAASVVLISQRSVPAALTTEVLVSV